MKQLLLIWTCLMLPVCMFGQHVAVSEDRANVFYEVVENPITITVENCKCDNLIVTADNGIIKLVSPCHYNVLNLKTGTANITVKKKQGNKSVEVGVRKFRVKPLPLPLVRFCGKSHGFINKSLLNASIGLTCSLEGFDFEMSSKITRFSVTVIRNGIVLFQENNAGNRFNDKIKGMLLTAQPKDHLIFNEVFCVYQTEAERALEPIEFTIVQ